MLFKIPPRREWDPPRWEKKEGASCSSAKIIPCLKPGHKHKTSLWGKGKEREGIGPYVASPVGPKRFVPPLVRRRPPGDDN